MNEKNKGGDESRHEEDQEMGWDEVTGIRGGEKMRTFCLRDRRKGKNCRRGRKGKLCGRGKVSSDFVSCLLEEIGVCFIGR